MTQQTLFDLRTTLPRSGQLQWIGVRPGRDVAMRELTVVDTLPGSGLVGDRYSGSRGIREVTLIQHEHLAVIAALLDRTFTVMALRRNLVVRGINLLALQQLPFRIGAVRFEGTGPCHPCSKMERVLGEGGYNAMRGHGGITARVVAAGQLHLGDEVCSISA